MQKSHLFLCIFLFSCLTYQPLYGQKFLQLSGDLFSDSWNNAGKWFVKPKQLKRNFLVGAGSVVLISGTMALDESLQLDLAQGQADQSSTFAQLSEPFGNPLKMGILALGSYYVSGYLNNESINGASSAALQAMLTAGVAAMTLKLLIHRERPEEQIIKDPFKFNGPSLENNNLSFPSGHSATAFALAASLSSYYQHDLRITIPLYLVAGLTAYQRVRDFKHWPSDVLAGALIGAWVGNKVGQWQRERSSLLNISFASNRWGGAGVSLSFQLD
jgi:hypothetical protein